jgi:hypothetical protein
MDKLLLAMEANRRHVADRPIGTPSW